MKLPVVRRAEAVRLIEGKLGLELERTREWHAWLRVDGKKVLRLTITGEHGGRAELSPGAVQRLHKDTTLSRDDFVALLNCSLSYAAYIEKLKDAGFV